VIIKLKAKRIYLPDGRVVKLTEPLLLRAKTWLHKVCLDLWSIVLN